MAYESTTDYCEYDLKRNERDKTQLKKNNLLRVSGPETVYPFLFHFSTNKKKERRDSTFTTGEDGVSFSIFHPLPSFPSLCFWYFILFFLINNNY